MNMMKTALLGLSVMLAAVAMTPSATALSCFGVGAVCQAAENILDPQGPGEYGYCPYSGTYGFDTDGDGQCNQDDQDDDDDGVSDECDPHDTANNAVDRSVDYVLYLADGGSC